MMEANRRIEQLIKEGGPSETNNGIVNVVVGDQQKLTL